MVLALVVMAVACVGFIVYQLREIALNHLAFQKEYGEQWQAKYEVRHGPLSEERVKVAIGVGGLATMGGLFYLIVRKIGRNPTGSLASRSGRRRRRR
jgi:hypothetical protein